MLIYLGGYKTKIGATGIYIKLDVEIIDGVTHRIKYETSGDAEVSEITYFRISFDKTALEEPGDRILESWAFGGMNNTEFIEPWGTITTAD